MHTTLDGCVNKRLNLTNNNKFETYSYGGVSQLRSCLLVIKKIFSFLLPNVPMEKDVSSEYFNLPEIVLVSISLNMFRRKNESSQYVSVLI